VFVEEAEEAPNACPCPVVVLGLDVYGALLDVWCAARGFPEVVLGADVAV